MLALLFQERDPRLAELSEDTGTTEGRKDAGMSASGRPNRDGDRAIVVERALIDASTTRVKPIVPLLAGLRVSVGLMRTYEAEQAHARRIKACL